MLYNVAMTAKARHVCVRLNHRQIGTLKDAKIPIGNWPNSVLPLGQVVPPRQVQPSRGSGGNWATYSLRGLNQSLQIALKFRLNFQTVSNLVFGLQAGQM